MRKILATIISLILAVTLTIPVLADTTKALHAKYTPIDYTITYNLDGGSLTGQKTTYNIETPTFILPTPTKPGYTFTGWSGTGLTGDTNKTVTVTKGSIGNRTYTAHWIDSLLVSALRFSSDSNFTLYPESKQWNGTLEYTTNKGATWTTWNGSKLSGTATQPIYIRGTGNSIISNFYSGWAFTGKYCTGNIENLLDYQKVAKGEHPAMAANCYSGIFTNCKSLTTAPELPATTLGDGCYYNMFQGCTSLKTAPELPATTLADDCYKGMFTRCTSLTTAPALPATKLVDSCYESMFTDCTSLTTAPELPATNMVDSCYQNMFAGCTSLTTPPVLHATKLTWYCYSGMFIDCKSLTTAPVLPATTLGDGCYYNMFQGCTSLKTAPALPATTLVDYCYEGMFNGCTALTTVPELPAATLTRCCYYNMFNGCTSLKLSTTQTGEYQYVYGISTTSTGISEIKALTDMFTNTGGAFTGTPDINTPYYTINPPVK